MAENKEQPINLMEVPGKGKFEASQVKKWAINNADSYLKSLDLNQDMYDQTKKTIIDLAHEIEKNNVSVDDYGKYTVKGSTAYNSTGRKDKRWYGGMKDTANNVNNIAYTFYNKLFESAPTYTEKPKEAPEGEKSWDFSKSLNNLYFGGKDYNTADWMVRDLKSDKTYGTEKRAKDLSSVFNEALSGKYKVDETKKPILQDLIKQLSTGKVDNSVYSNMTKLGISNPSQYFYQTYNNSTGAPYTPEELSAIQEEQNKVSEEAAAKNAEDATIVNQNQELDTKAKTVYNQLQQIMNSARIGYSGVNMSIKDPRFVNDYKLSYVAMDNDSKASPEQRKYTTSYFNPTYWGTLTVPKKSDLAHVRAAIDISKRSKKLPPNVVADDKGNYYLADSWDDNNSVFMYDYNNNGIKRVNVFHTPLKDKALELYQNSLIKKANITPKAQLGTYESIKASLTPSQKEGGIIEFQQGGKALTRDELFKEIGEKPVLMISDVQEVGDTSKDQIADSYNISSTPNNEVETPRVGGQKKGIGKDAFGKIDDATKLRFGALGADVASFVAGFSQVPGLSTGIGLIGTGMNLKADLDSGIPTGEALGNAAVSGGLDLISGIPFLGTASKAARIGKTVSKGITLAMGIKGISDILSPESFATLKKAYHSGISDLTIDDYRKLTNIFMLLSGATGGYIQGRGQKKLRDAKETGKFVLKTNIGDIPATAAEVANLRGLDQAKRLAELQRISGNQNVKMKWGVGNPNSFWSKSGLTFKNIPYKEYTPAGQMMFNGKPTDYAPGMGQSRYKEWVFEKGHNTTEHVGKTPKPNSMQSKMEAYYGKKQEVTQPIAEVLQSKPKANVDLNRPIFSPLQTNKPHVPVKPETSAAELARSMFAKNKVEKKQDGGVMSTGTGLTDLKNKKKVSLNPEDVLATSRYLLSLYGNKKATDQILDEVKPTLVSTFNLNAPIMGDLSTKQYYDNTAANLEQQYNTPFTSDASLTLGTRFEAGSKAQDLRDKGMLADANAWKQSMQQNFSVNASNQERNASVANANMAAMNKANLDKASLRSGLTTQNTSDTNTLLASLEERFRTNKARMAGLTEKDLTLTHQYDLQKQMTPLHQKMQDLQEAYDKAPKATRGDFEDYAGVSDITNEIKKVQLESNKSYIQKLKDLYKINGLYNTSTQEPWQPVYKLGGKINEDN